MLQCKPMQTNDRAPLINQSVVCMPRTVCMYLRQTALCLGSYSVVHGSRFVNHGQLVQPTGVTADSWLTQEVPVCQYIGSACNDAK